MATSLPSEIKQEQFANHNGENRSDSPPESNIEEYNIFTNHMNNRRKLELVMIKKKLLNEETIKKCIITKGNLSAPDLDRLTYPMFKYCPDKAAKIFKFILNMMTSTHKSPQCLKE
jgi:hypothetical protein